MRIEYKKPLSWILSPCQEKEATIKEKTNIYEWKYKKTVRIDKSIR